MIVQPFEGRRPRFGARVYVAPTAVVVGDVELGDDASLWFGVVVRGDIHHIRIGPRCNLQDGVIVHVEKGLYPTILEPEVSVGHGAVLHGCTVRHGTLVGMGALVLNQADIGACSIVAAGAVVREGFSCPPRSLLVGVPAVVRRELTAAEVERALATATNYVEYKNRYLAGSGPEVTP